MGDTELAKFDRLDIYERDGFRCRYCGFDGTTFNGWKSLQIDHIDPTGSRHDPDNLATCCVYCNAVKSNDPCKSVEEAIAIVRRHDGLNRTYWETHVRSRIPQRAATDDGAPV